MYLHQLTAVVSFFFLKKKMRFKNICIEIKEVKKRVSHYKRNKASPSY